MPLEDIEISRSIIKAYHEKLLDSLELDVALVGGGPANMVAGYYLGKAGVKAAVYESKLAPGGGMWGGGMMFNEIALQEDALPIVDEMGISYKPAGGGYYTVDSVAGHRYAHLPVRWCGYTDLQPGEGDGCPVSGGGRRAQGIGPRHQLVAR